MLDDLRPRQACVSRKGGNENLRRRKRGEMASEARTPCYRYTNGSGESRGNLRGGATTVITLSETRQCSEAYNVYDLDRAIPGARAECVFGDQIPVNGKHLPLVFVPRLDRELIECYIE